MIHCQKILCGGSAIMKLQPVDKVIVMIVITIH